MKILYIYAPLLLLFIFGMSFYDPYDKFIMTSFLYTCFLVFFNASCNLAVSKYFTKSMFDVQLTQLMYVAIMILIPIMEESLFRFTLIKHLEYIFETSMCCIISSIIFGLVHISNYFLVNKKGIDIKLRVLIQFICTTLLGLILSSTNSLLVSILLHSYYNAMSYMLLMKIESHIVKNNEINIATKFGSNSKLLYMSKRRKSYPQVDCSKINVYLDDILVSNETYQAHNEMTRKIYKATFRL